MNKFFKDFEGRVEQLQNREVEEADIIREIKIKVLKKDEASQEANEGFENLSNFYK